MSLCFSQSSLALSLSLDSIAEWGKFPRFCINTYRWADEFFNSYDSAYVVGTGMRFNVKTMADSYVDYYRFQLTDGTRVDLVSDASTSVGVYLTYMAVSAGYDVNVSKLLGRHNDARKRYNLGLNCSLFSVETYWVENEVGTRMTRFDGYNGDDLDFNSVLISSWGIDTYYFFNNNRYSQAAAFSYGKIQKRSQGSLYAGLSIFTQKYDFNFNGLPQHMMDLLPEWWADNHFRLRTNNYGFRFGYAYNCVLSPKWLFGVSISPIMGVAKGYINSEKEELSFSLYNHLKMSVVWNSGRWFGGLIGQIKSALVPDRETVFAGNDLNFSCSLGYRFNLW